MSFKKLYGIEIEVEKRADRDTGNYFPSEYWRVSKDASLIDGFEFKSHTGRAFCDLLDDISKLETKEFSLMNFSAGLRTGLHIHINTLFMPQETKVRLIKVYMILERLLFATTDSYRELNIFCKPLYSTDSNRYIKRFTNGLISGDVNFRGVSKYSGMGLTSLSKFSTFELRYHAGTVNTIEIIKYLKLADRMVDLALSETDLFAMPSKDWITLFGICLKMDRVDNADYLIDLGKADTACVN